MNYLLIISLINLCRLAAAAGPDPVLLGTAADYVILAKAGIDTKPNSVITGDIAVSPIAGTALTGFDPVTNAGAFSTASQVVGKMYSATSDPPTPDTLGTAVGFMGTAFTDANSRPGPNITNDLSGLIGGATYYPGLYKWTSAVIIGSDITLAANSSSDSWIFQIADTLDIASAMSIILSGPVNVSRIVWVVEGQVTFGTTSHFVGTVLAKTGIAMQTSSSILGRLLSQTAVTLDQAVVTQPAVDEVVSSSSSSSSVSSSSSSLSESSSSSVSSSSDSSSSDVSSTDSLSSSSAVSSSDSVSSSSTSASSSSISSSSALSSSSSSDSSSSALPSSSSSDSSSSISTSSVSSDSSSSNISSDVLPSSSSSIPSSSQSSITSVLTTSSASSTSSSTSPPVPTLTPKTFKNDYNQTVTNKGCWTDYQAPNRLLAYPALNSSSMTPQLCSSICSSKGFTLAGNEWNHECWCGNTLPTGSADKVCDMPCSGDSTQLCGGGWRVNIWSLDGPTHPGSVSHAPLGCFKDNINDRSLRVRADLNTLSMTQSICQNYCSLHGFPFAGLEYSGECWCDSKIVSERVNDQGQCNMQCTGDTAEICGGSNRLTVFQLFGITTPQSKSYVNDGNNLAWAYDTCWGEPQSGRAFAHPIENWSKGGSIESCLTSGSSLGFQSCGLEYGGECWCKTKEEYLFGGKIPESYCDMPCLQHNSEACGSGNVLSIYTRL